MASDPPRIFEAIIEVRTQMPIVSASVDRAHRRIDALEEREADELRRSTDRWRGMLVWVLERIAMPVAAIGAYHVAQKAGFIT